MKSSTRSPGRAHARDWSRTVPAPTAAMMTALARRPWLSISGPGMRFPRSADVAGTGVSRALTQEQPQKGKSA